MAEREPDSRYGGYSGAPKPKQPAVKPRFGEGGRGPAQASTAPSSIDEPANRSRLPVVCIGAVMATAVSVVMYRYLGAQATMHQALPTLLVAVIVGFAVRALGRREALSHAVIAVVFTIVGCLAGIAWADYHRWSPPMLEPTLRRMFLSEALLFYAVAGYLAYIISRPRDGDA